MSSSLPQANVPAQKIDPRYWRLLPGGNTFAFRYKMTERTDPTRFDDEVKLINELGLRPVKITPTRPALRPTFWYLTEGYVNNVGVIVKAAGPDILHGKMIPIYRMWLGGLYHGEYSTRGDAVHWAGRYLMHERLRGGYTPDRFVGTYFMRLWKNKEAIADITARVREHQSAMGFYDPNMPRKVLTGHNIMRVGYFSGVYKQYRSAVIDDDTFDYIPGPENIFREHPKLRGN